MTWPVVDGRIMIVLYGSNESELGLLGAFGRASGVDSLPILAGVLPNSFREKVIFCWFCEVILLNELRGF